MQVTVRDYCRELGQYCVYPEDKVFELIQKVSDRKGIDPDDVKGVIFRLRYVALTKTFAEQNIPNGAILTFNVIKLKGGGIFSNSVIDENGTRVDADFDNNENNHARLTDQVGGTCYAHAAASAYVNTARRIYGVSVPPLAACIEIAIEHQGTEGGFAHRAVNKLDMRFKLGIFTEISLSPPSPFEIMSKSVIVSFDACQAGWVELAGGRFLADPDPESPSNGRHACLIEGWKFEDSTAILKNSWGQTLGNPQNGRARVSFSALRNPYYVIVGFILKHIPLSFKLFGVYEPNKRLLGLADTDLFPNCEGLEMWECDEKTARHETNLYCIRRQIAGVDGHVYLGVRLDEYCQRQEAAHANCIIF